MYSVFETGKIPLFLGGDHSVVMRFRLCHQCLYAGSFWRGYRPDLY
ncbi:MAG: hypothetical protein ACLUUO_03200 [Sellimonas intestinalis]